MKLRNKKTGEIVSLIEIININGRLFARLCEPTGNVFKREIKTLSDLFNEWEDALEEPKDFWYIDPEVLIACESTDPLLCDKKVAIETMKRIGNYFETKEEAEKAVEKLKAWKRLKDKGFKFDGIAGITNEIYFKAKEPFTHIMVDEYTADKTEKEYIDDLMLLFRGEE